MCFLQKGIKRYFQSNPIQSNFTAAGQCWVLTQRKIDLFLKVRMSWSIWKCFLGVRNSWEETRSHRGSQGCVDPGAEFSPALEVELCGLGESFQLIFCGHLAKRCCFRVLSAFFYSIAAKPRETWILSLLLWWVSTLLLSAGCRRPGRWALGVYMGLGGRGGGGK